MKVTTATLLLLGAFFQPCWAGLFTVFHAPDSVNTNAHGLNDGGLIVGVFQTDTSGATYSYIREVDGSFLILDFPGAITTDGKPATYASDVNNSAIVVGSIGTGKLAAGISATRGFVRSPDGVLTLIDKPGAQSTSVIRINDANLMLGSFVDGSGEFGWFLRDSLGVYSEIEKPAEWRGMGITGLNNAGTLVGGYSLPGITYGRGFIRTAGGSLQLIDVPGARQTTPQSINDKGDIIGTFIDSGGVWRGFVRYAEGNFEFFDIPTYLPGFGGAVMSNYTIGHDISNDRTIIGFANIYNASVSGNVSFFGQLPFDPFPVPEPRQTAAVIGTFIVFILRTRKSQAVLLRARGKDIGSMKPRSTAQSISDARHVDNSVRCAEIIDIAKSASQI